MLFSLLCVKGDPNVCFMLPSDDVLHELSRKIAGLKIAKSMVGWDLDELESAALEETERQSDSDDESEDEIEQMLPAPL